MFGSVWLLRMDLRILIKVRKSLYRHTKYLVGSQGWLLAQYQIVVIVCITQTHSIRAY